MNDGIGLNLMLTEAELEILEDLINAYTCETRTVTINAYTWEHKCGDTCPDAASGSQCVAENVGDICEVGGYNGGICLKVHSLLVGTPAGKKYERKKLFERETERERERETMKREVAENKNSVGACAQIK